ncbi:hypothetical protein [Enterobacter sp. ENT03]|uniref:hypothetical protein n=1 Tax=Enterobacter sp. ENT03 TaxID=2854780 RepID=UPI001C459F49|nr:hypothetical protein [Enterobacter sp. ENT03]MBV7403585.1 hypothetical protein [Enterobacter sp. ENT03]
MCQVVLHVSERTGCVCSLNERGEFVIATVLSSSVIHAGDLVVESGCNSGPVNVFNVTQDAWLTLDVHCRTRSEIYARKLLNTMASEP